MNFYENIEAERERIQRCISKYGHTSDHNLDWYSDSIIEVEAEPVFVEFDDGTGLLTHRDSDKWRIWSDPLSQESDMADRIGEFAVGVFKDEKIKEVWCDDVSDKIYPELKKNQSLKLNDPYYHLFWPVLDMAKYNPALPGGHFKETRNAKNKFYREHKLDVVKTPGRFAGVIGIHDYSIKDLGTILWLEDLGWIKNSGYKELDMQGNEYEWELKQKTQFGAVIERKTDTFSITSL